MLCRQTLKTGARWMVHADSLWGMYWQAGSGYSRGMQEMCQCQSLVLFKMQPEEGGEALFPWSSYRLQCWTDQQCEDQMVPTYGM